MNLGRVNPEMFCEPALLPESFAAMVTLERLLTSVRPHVTLQMARGSASIALVTLVWLFSCVLTNHVFF